jgi:hypothetical protein
LATSWERFHLLTNSGPNLALLDHVLLQHFFIGLTQKAKDFLTVASGGSFLHISSEEARKILDKILADKTEEPPVENPLEEESEELEAELMPTIPTSESLKMEVIPLPNFMLDFEDELFAEYGNTSRYYSIRKP